MATLLLVTKLFIPPARPELVARPRLVERLNTALSYGLVVVSAPAGFGKTTLVSEWIRNSEPRVPTAWLSLEEADSDPARFWDYFISALRTIKPTVGDTSLALLHSAGQLSIDSILAPLINDLSSVSTDFVLVLDDYHFVQSDAVHQGLTFFLEHLPPKMHLVIATRVDPPLRLAHLRGKGAILEIGADDLRFTFTEATRLLKAVTGLELPSEDLNTINERTEGWVVGLKMAALSLSKQRDVKESIAAFAGSRRYVMDYLTDEVLSQQPAPMHDFLLKTSVLERLGAPLCDLVTGRSDSADMLREIERSHLFIVALDESGEWYRYEHLFADALRHRLELEAGKDVVAELHKKASQWFAEYGFPENAVNHALAARDWERAINLLDSQSNGYRKRGEFKTLLDWFQAIPEDVLRSHPRLYGQYARVIMRTGRLDAAEVALSYLEKTTETSAFGQGELAFYRALLTLNRGDLGSRVESLERALALLPPENIEMRAVMSFNLGLIRHNQSRFEEARKLLTDAREMARQSGDRWTYAMAAGSLSYTLYLQGKLRQSLAAAQEAVGLVGHSPAALSPLLSTCIVLFELNDLTGVEQAARLGIELSERDAPMWRSLRVSHYVFLAVALLLEGDVAGAEASMSKADETANLQGGTVNHAAFRAWFDLMKGDLEDARRWSAQVSEYPGGSPSPTWELVPVRLLIVSGEKQAAVERLRNLYAQAIEAGGYGLLIRIRIYQALTADSAEEALVFLADALKRGEPEGYVRPFTEEGKLMAPLLRQVVRRGIQTEYARKLLSIIEAEERRRQAATPRRVPIPQSSEFLSQRELEVLRLAAEGLSNRQIAEKLTVTLGTAKAHLHNITRKLGASSRTQAIARARELKFI